MKITTIITALLFATVSAFAGSDQDNRSNQMNPNNDAYWESRGNDERPSDWQERTTYSSGSYGYSDQELNNHSNQLNPNNDAYWQSRGYNERPSDWQELTSYSSGSYDYSDQELNNHSNQLNSNNDAYWQSRGYDGKPECWDENIAEEHEDILSVIDDIFYFSVQEESNKSQNIQGKPILIELHDNMTTYKLIESYILKIKIPEVEELSKDKKIELARGLAEITTYTCRIFYDKDEDLKELCEIILGTKALVSIDETSKFFRKLNLKN